MTAHVTLKHIMELRTGKVGAEPVLQNGLLGAGPYFSRDLLVPMMDKTIFDCKIIGKCLEN